MKPRLLVLCFIALALPAFAQKGTTMELHSSAFSNGQPIPQKYSCQGADISPALTWSGAPATTKSFLLIVSDPDAPSGTFTHWILSNIPPATHALPEAFQQGDGDLNGYEGINDFNKDGYSGPCPPPGKPHRYFFKLYALDTKLALKPGSARQSIERTIQGHILAQTELLGTYQRK